MFCLSSIRDYLGGSHNPLQVGRSFVHDVRFYADNPWYFEPNGIWLYCGCQGSGKTLSAVKTAKKMLAEYPAAKLCTNLQLKGFGSEVIPFTGYHDLNITNGIYGIVFLIDEMQVLWNSLESKNIPISEIALFAQNRKDRRVIIGTSQVYSRVAKPIREQLKYVILCHNFLKYIQVNTLVDPNAEGYTGEQNGELEGEIVRKFVWFHTPEDYESYDTYAKIDRIQRKAVSR